MEITFALGLKAWEDFNKEVHLLILQNEFIDVAEIGGGANPLLTLEFINEKKLNYDVLDISIDELEKADTKYNKIALDLEKPIDNPKVKYDFIFAQMTMEHINDPHTFYSNVYKLLNTGGQAYFFFACVTSLPSFINYIIPEALSEKILLALQPFRHNEKHGKFKAFYKWCLGPTSKNINRYKKLNFTIVSYTGYFGHSYYQRVKFLHFLEKIKTSILLKYPFSYLCSYAHVILKKS